ncbi:MAG TPA: HAD family phosphatase [Allosphingosinicella sp.]|jgi:HAD superfamily hydrolase (TIGR01509 family)|uniref:HAD family hydrolase n=1 Tax=Allosphingosinicella sp. TaxID=2823234 RepID=UPI002F27BEEC
MIKAVLFDVDGTLIDSNDLHAAAWREAFLHFGVDLPHDVIRSQIGKGGDNLIPALLPPELVEAREEEIDSYRSDLFKRDYLPRVVPFPGVRDLFERLRADGKRIVLASSAKAEEVHFHLGVIGAEDLVEATTSADDAKHSKPDPDIFAAAIAKLSPLGPGDVVVVGDSPYDIQASAKLGIRSVGFLSGGFPEEVLRDAGAAEIYDGPQDLLARYDRSLLSS